MRQPRHTVGWLFVAIGFFNALTSLSLPISELQGSSLATGLDPHEQPQVLIRVIGELVWITALFLPLTLMLQFFPDGRLPSRRWWPITVATVIGMVGTAIGFEAERGYTGVFSLLADFAVPFMMFSILGSAGSVLARYIRSRGFERLQMKWLVYTAVVGILLIFLFLLVLGEEHPVLGIYTVLLPNLLAGTVGIAILRYRLFDIDLIIRRTLQYGNVTGLLAVVYLGLILILQSIFVSLGDTDSSIFIVLSTLVVAGLFNPLRLRVQRAIDRRFYRRKYQAEQVLSQFAASARDEVELQKLTSELLEVVQETMQPESVGFLLISDDRNTSKGAIALRTRT
jgi:hypothetical protein